MKLQDHDVDSELDRYSEFPEILEKQSKEEELEVFLLRKLTEKDGKTRERTGKKDRQKERERKEKERRGRPKSPRIRTKISYDFG